MCTVQSVEKHFPGKVSLFFDQQLQVLNVPALPDAGRSRLRASLLRSQAEPAQGLSSTFTESLGMPKDETPGTSCSHCGVRQEPGTKSSGTQSPSWITAPWQGGQGCGARRGQPQLPRAHTSPAGLWHRPGRQPTAASLPWAGSTSFIPTTGPADMVRWQSRRISIQLWGHPFPSVLSVLFTRCSCGTLLTPPNPAGERSYKPQLPRRESEVCNTAAIPSQQSI